MKGIILAGGSGTRMYPLTLVTSKQLLPVYDKPMIYYPLSTLMLAGIRDILIISTPFDIENFKRLLGNGKHLGVSIKYEIQPSPDGLAQAFIIGENFIGQDSCAMILGDNIFYGSGLIERLVNARKDAEDGISTIFGYHVNDPKRFGIMELDKDLKILSIEEKPEVPKSNYCITGLYFYTNEVISIAKKVKPSKRGELEITSVNQMFLDKGLLKAQLLGRGYAWIDMGTIDSLVEVTNYIQIIEKRQGIKISVPEEIAFRNKWIGIKELKERASVMGKSGYSDYLIGLANSGVVL